MVVLLSLESVESGIFLKNNDYNFDNYLRPIKMFPYNQKWESDFGAKFSTKLLETP